jgi:hypothetical protein
VVDSLLLEILFQSDWLVLCRHWTGLLVNRLFKSLEQYSGVVLAESEVGNVILLDCLVHRDSPASQRLVCIEDVCVVLTQHEILLFDFVADAACFRL